MLMRRRDIRFFYATLDNLPCEQVWIDGVPVGWVYRAKPGLWGIYTHESRSWLYDFGSKRDAVRSLVRMDNGMSEKRSSQPASPR